MNDKKMKIQIKPDGLIEVSIQGIKGKKCLDYIRILEDILEAETIDSRFTEEYFEVKSNNIENQLQKNKSLEIDYE